MPTIEIVVGLGLAAALLAALAQAIGVHYAIVLVLGGLVLDFIPGVPDLRVRPDLVLFVFLPRLVYAAAVGTSAQDLPDHARRIAVLSVGLVVVTMLGVGCVVHLLSGIGWGLLDGPGRDSGADRPGRRHRSAAAAGGT